MAIHFPLPPDAPKKLAVFDSPVEPEDDVIIFFAGHGIAHGGKFYLLPYNLQFRGMRAALKHRVPSELLKSAISGTQLYQSLLPLQSQSIVLAIDACNSGQILGSENDRVGFLNSRSLGQLAFDKGIYVLAASQAYQTAVESTRYGHGLLSEALIEGLHAADADTTHDGYVDTREWLQYASHRVPELQMALYPVTIPRNQLQQPRVFLPYQGATAPAMMGNAYAPVAEGK